MTIILATLIRLEERIAAGAAAAIILATAVAHYLSFNKAKRA